MGDGIPSPSERLTQLELRVRFLRFFFSSSADFSHHLFVCAALRDHRRIITAAFNGETAPCPRLARRHLAPSNKLQGAVGVARLSVARARTSFYLLSRFRHGYAIVACLCVVGRCRDAIPSGVLQGVFRLVRFRTALCRRRSVAREAFSAMVNLGEHKRRVA